MKLAAKEQKREYIDEYRDVRAANPHIQQRRNESDEFLNIEDISDNLRRLEKLQEDLNKNRFS